MITRKLKFVTIGDSRVGKTSLLLRIAEGSFMANTATTVGVEFKKKNEIIEGNLWLVEMWDTTGQQRYRKVVSQFFRGIHAAIIVFDISNENSFEAVNYWLSELNNCVSQQIPKILFGNKSDLLEVQIHQDFQKRIDDICKQHNLIYFKGSVKTGENIDLLYRRVIDQAYKIQPEQLKKPPNVKVQESSLERSIMLKDTKSPKKPTGNKCC